MHSLQSSTLISGFFATLALANPHLMLMPRNTTTATNLGVVPDAGVESGNWSTALCSALGDPGVDPAVRWSEGDAEDAFTAVERFWNEVPGSSEGMSFVRTVAHFFNGPENWNCGTMGSDPCAAGPGSCGDKTEHGNVNSPAGWFILQSFTTLHNFQYNQYLAIGDAESSVQGKIGDFASAFAPIEDHESAIKILLDIFGLGFSLVSAGVWNKILKDAAIFKAPNDPNNHGWFKDASNAAVSGSLTLSKDKLPSVQSALSAQNSLSDFVSTLISDWRGVISDYTSGLFSGSASTLSQLHGQISNGKGLNDDWGNIGLYDMESIMAKTLYGLLIPKAWQTSNTDVHPVILLPKNNAQGCTGNPNSDFISNSISAESGVCYNNQAYYLFNVAGGPCNNIRVRESAPPPPCPYSILSALPGIGTLDGTQWGGVTRDDLVISALQGYQLNNNANGYQMPDLSTATDGQGGQGDLYFENGIQTPGVTTIPICTFDTVATNWEKYGNSKSKPDGYPCN